jgi:hypothetical protein
MEKALMAYSERSPASRSHQPAKCLVAGIPLELIVPAFIVKTMKVPRLNLVAQNVQGKKH